MKKIPIAQGAVVSVLVLIALTSTTLNRCRWLPSKQEGEVTTAATIVARQQEQQLHKHDAHPRRRPPPPPIWPYPPVPSGGVESVLLTSITEPPFRFYAHHPSIDRYLSAAFFKGIYEQEMSDFIDILFPLYEQHDDDDGDGDDGNDDEEQPVDSTLHRSLSSSMRQRQRQRQQQQQEGGGTATRRQKQRPIALDLGANVGFHSLHMAARGASVISFEASPDTAWILISGAAINGFLANRPDFGANDNDDHDYDHDKAGVSGTGTVTPVAMGASDTHSFGRMVRHSGSPGMTSFASANATSFPMQQGRKESALDADIELLPARDVLSKLGVPTRNGGGGDGGDGDDDEEDGHIDNSERLRLLKVDVEGYELHALKGVDLDRYPFRYLTFEFFPAMLTGCGTNPADLIMYVWSKGYRFFDLVTEAAATVDVKKKEEKERSAEKENDNGNGGVTWEPWEREKDMGGDDAAAVRKVAEMWASKGRGSKKREEYHINLFAKRVK